MVRFDFYVIERQLKIFGLLVGTLVAVLWINLAARGFADFLSGSQAIRLLLVYIFYELPPSLYQSLALAAYASTTYVCYRLFVERELWAMQSAGASPARLMRPFLGFAALIAVLATILVHEILPDSSAQSAKIKIRLQSDISQFRVKPKQFLFPTDGVAIFVGDVSDQGELKNVFIHTGSDLDTRRVSHFAKTARMTKSGGDTLFEMSDGTTQLWDLKDDAIRWLEFEMIRFNVSELAEGLGGAPSLAKYATSLTLLRQLREDDISEIERHRIGVEIHQRIAYVMAALLFPIIGAAALILGAALRVRLFLPILASLGVIVSLFLLGEFLEDWVLVSGTTFLQLYISPLIGVLLTIMMTMMAVNLRQLMKLNQ